MRLKLTLKLELKSKVGCEASKRRVRVMKRAMTPDPIPEISFYFQICGAKKKSEGRERLLHVYRLAPSLCLWPQKSSPFSFELDSMAERKRHPPGSGVERNQSPSDYRRQ